MKLKTMTAVAALLLACAGAAKAQEAKAPASPYGTFSGTVSATTDYRFRGITQSGERPAVQGSIDWAHDGGLYAGVWGSSIDFNDNNEATIETDVYAGMKFAFSGLSMDIGIIGYLDPGANSTLNYDYWEGKVAAGYDLGFASLSAGMNYSPDYFGASGDGLYTAVGVSVPVMETGVTVNGSYGYQSIEKNVNFGGIPDYSAWSAGLGYKWNGFDFKADYVDTSVSKTNCADGCDEAGIVTVSRTF